jgi:hypothetical protein
VPRATAGRRALPSPAAGHVPPPSSSPPFLTPARYFPELLSVGADLSLELLPPTCPQRKTKRSSFRPQPPSHRPAGLCRRTCESGSRRLACATVASVLGVEERADVWGPHVIEWKENNTEHVCTNTIRQRALSLRRRRKWQRSGKRRIVVVNFKIRE